jgi:ABC-type dipeptide/oligopeptide/nickel transport system permease subunit
LATVGSVLLVGLVLLAISAPLLTRIHWLKEPIHQDQNGLDSDGMPLPVSGTHVLGTDNLGRDVLARTIHGARVSLSVGTAAVLAATLVGVTVGLLAGFYGGKMDLGLMRLTEIALAIPSILLAVALAGLMDKSRIIHLHPAALPWHSLDIEFKRGVASLFIVIGFVSWPGMVRVIRGQVLSLKERDYITAARALGATDLAIIFRHLIPNLLPTVIILSVMNTGNTILIEAGLGYLGIGVPPPAPTWGSMVADGQPYFIAAPHIVIVPGVAILLTVLSFNLLGQGLQEVMDPKRER